MYVNNVKPESVLSYHITHHYFIMEVGVCTVCVCLCVSLCECFFTKSSEIFISRQYVYMFECKCTCVLAGIFLIIN